MRRTDLPTMTKCNGCSNQPVKNACCTIVRARPAEAKCIRRFIKDNGIEWQQNEGIQCGFLQDGMCSIYEVRPWACRAFGVIRQMPCSHFPKEAQLDFPPEQTVVLRLSDPDDAFLGWYFEDGYYERMKVALKPHGYQIGVS